MQQRTRPSQALYIGGDWGAIVHQGFPLLDGNIAGTLRQREGDDMEIDAALLPGGYEWIVILGVVLIFFGPKKLPELARGLGKGLREFRQASDEMVDTIKNADLEDPRELPSASESLPVTPATEAAEVVEDRPESS